MSFFFSQEKHRKSRSKSLCCVETIKILSLFSVSGNVSSDVMYLCCLSQSRGWEQVEGRILDRGILL